MGLTKKIIVAFMRRWVWVLVVRRGENEIISIKMIGYNVGDVILSNFVMGNR